MKRILPLGILVLRAAMFGGPVLAQPPAQPSAAPDSGNTTATAGTDLSTAILEWTPPALTQLSAHAEAKESFTLDRNLLAAASGLLPQTDADVKQSLAKLDGVSVHLLRFAANGTANAADVDALREAYHLRGWKHVVSGANIGGAAQAETTDIWVVMDGANVRGAVVLMESPKSLTIATMAGNLSPVDILHLRGHFGIPRFEGDALQGEIGK